MPVRAYGLVMQADNRTGTEGGKEAAHMEEQHEVSSAENNQPKKSGFGKGLLIGLLG
jgi:hypothetical protein